MEKESYKQLKILTNRINFFAKEISFRFFAEHIVSIAFLIFLGLTIFFDCLSTINIFNIIPATISIGVLSVSGKLTGDTKGKSYWKIERAEWLGDYRQENGTAVRYASFSCRRYRADYTAHYTAEIPEYAAEATYSDTLWALFSSTNVDPISKNMDRLIGRQ